MRSTVKTNEWPRTLYDEGPPRNMKQVSVVVQVKAFDIVKTIRLDNVQ